MTINEALMQVFQERPEVWLTTRRLQTILKDMFRKPIYPSQIRKGLLELRDEHFNHDGRVLVKFKMSSLDHHHYTLTNKKGLIAAHNHQLTKKIKKQEKRKIVLVIPNN